jgi:hypothetical protein
MNLKSNKFGLTIAVALTGCALVSSASAATISENPLAPSGNILASQLTDLGPGTQDNNRDYANNKGPAGQTFQVGSAGTMGSLTILGRGDSASAWTSGPVPFDGTEVWGIEIGSVNTGTGAITVLDSETAPGFVSTGVVSNYLTFSLATPVALTPGTTYEWSVLIGNPADSAWFGLAHSVGDAYASGYAMNNNTSIANPGGGNPTGSGNTTFGGFAAPNANNYDYVFAIQGVPEPATMALFGLAGFGMLAALRRRRS